MPPCPQCHAQLPENAAFCPFCGLRIFVATPGEPRHLREHAIGALAYITVVPAIVFLLIGRFRDDSFVRFHSLQSIYLTVAGVVIVIAMRFVYAVLVLIPRLGFLIAWLSIAIALLGWTILWIVLVIKALQGERLKLPVIGRLAEQN